MRTRLPRTHPIAFLLFPLLVSCGDSNETYPITRRVAAPVLDPPSATFDRSITVNVSTLTENAVVHCSEDGSDPTEESPIVTEAILRESTVLLCRGYKEDFAPSAMVSGLYTYDPAKICPLFEITRFTTPAIQANTTSLGDLTYDGAAAVFDLDGSGGPEVLLARANQSDDKIHYWMGRNLLSSGDADFSENNLYNTPIELGPKLGGLGIALGDVGGHSEMDLVVAGVSVRDWTNAQEAEIRYRVFYDLDANGDYRTAGGATYVVDVPVGELGTKPNGLGISFADLNGNRINDLIVGWVDDGCGADSTSCYTTQDEFRYIVGYDMKSTGAIDTWSRVYRKPPPMPTLNYGADLVVTSFGQGPELDLVLVWNADVNGREDWMFYQVGYDMHADGRVSGWADQPIRGPSFGFLTQGAGIAAVPCELGPKLLFMQVDNPGVPTHNNFRYALAIGSGVSKPSPGPTPFPTP